MAGELASHTKLGHMQHHHSAILAVLLLAGLSGCTTGPSTATPPASTTADSMVAAATSRPSPTQTARAVPDVVGMIYLNARVELNHAGLYGPTYGEDGTKWGSTTIPDATVKVVSTVPAAGTVTDSRDIRIVVSSTEAENTARAAGAAETAVLTARYTFDCSGNYSSAKTTSGVYKTLEEVWASPEYKDKTERSCNVQIENGEAYMVKTLQPNEKAVADVIVAHGGGTYGSPAGDFGTALELCAKPKLGYNDHVGGRPEATRADAYGALALCPNAPHVELLRQVATTVKVDDGTKVIGKTMEAGTYRTNPGAKDCYWSRTDGGGHIIDNAFVGFAPDGVTVTVYPGEGFESSNCKVWTRIG